VVSGFYKHKTRLPNSFSIGIEPIRSQIHLFSGTPPNPKFNYCLCESRDISIAEQMDVYVRLVKNYSLRLLVE
jgi:hypothetical protein